MNVEEFLPNEIDVQKAVVESLAADKAEQDEKISSIEKENALLKTEIGKLKGQIDEMKAALEKVGDLLSLNSESRSSNQVALLDRNQELNDRFEGETRDHVLEVIREARENAEKDGRLRLAQVLEGVLVANEPNGTLKKKREELQKLFSENANVINGTVIEALKNMGISHKNGEEYLLPCEILKRTY